MIANNGSGVIRIGRKGLRKFAFGDDGSPFEVDVVTAFRQLVTIDEGFRPADADDEGNRPIPTESMLAYNQAMVAFVQSLACGDEFKPGRVPDITVAEALDFIARLREQYDELADFFRVKLRPAPGLPATSEAPSVRFSVEGVEN